MSEASSPIGIPQPTSPQSSLSLSLSPTWEVLQVIEKIVSFNRIIYSYNKIINYIIVFVVGVARRSEGFTHPNGRIFFFYWFYIRKININWFYKKKNPIRMKVLGWSVGHNNNNNI